MRERGIIFVTIPVRSYAVAGDESWGHDWLNQLIEKSLDLSNRMYARVQSGMDESSELRKVLLI